MTVKQSNSWTYNGKKAQAVQIRGDMALINIDGETERRWVKRSELVLRKHQWKIKEHSK